MSRSLTPEQVARARELIAELSALLDAADAPRASRKHKTPAPERKAKPEAVAMIHRRLRRIGVSA